MTVCDVNAACSLLTASEQLYTVTQFGFTFQSAAGPVQVKLFPVNNWVGVIQPMKHCEVMNVLVPSKVTQRTLQ